MLCTFGYKEVQMSYSLSEIKKRLGLTQNELADILDVSKRSIAYVLKGQRTLSKSAVHTVNKLSEAIKAAEALARDAGTTLPALPASLPYHYFVRRAELAEKIYLIQKRLRWLEHRYPQLLRAEAIVNLVDVSGLHADPLSEKMARNVASKVKHRLRLKLSKIDYANEVRELRIKLRLLEAEQKVLGEMDS